MPFTDPQKSWIDESLGHAGNFEREVVRQEQRNDFLQRTLQNQLLECRASIQSAMEFEVTLGPHENETKWEKLRRFGRRPTVKAMSDGNADEEFDTVADLPGVQESLTRYDEVALYQAHGRLIELQQQMIDAKDDHGNPLFTEKDIMDELWTPLIREQIIPANVVSDRYSQDAQLFEGACQIYEAKLTSYTEGIGEHDTALQALGGVKSMAQFGGAIATETLNIGNFTAVSYSQEEMDTIKTFPTRPKVNGKPISDDDWIQHRLTLDPEIVNKIETRELVEAQITLAKERQKAVTATLAITNGSFALAEAACKNRDEAFFSSVVGVVETTIQSCLPLANATSPEAKTRVQRLQHSLTATFAGLKLGNKLVHATITNKDRDIQKGFRQCVDLVAVAIASVFAATDDTDSDGAGARTGARIATHIRSAANLPAAVNAYRQTPQTTRDWPIAYSGPDSNKPISMPR